MKKETILVAEDSHPNRQILVHLLKKLNYEVVEAKSGTDAKTALAALEADTEKELVCLITDIMMPGMDGLSLIKELRSHAKFEKLPVVVVTAVADKNNILAAKDLHVAGFIVKPVTFQRVLEKLREIFPKREFPKVAA